MARAYRWPLLRACGPMMCYPVYVYVYADFNMFDDSQFKNMRREEICEKYLGHGAEQRVRGGVCAWLAALKMWCDVM